MTSTSSMRFSLTLRFSSLSEYEVSERVGLTNLDMTIKNIKCYDIVVGDVSISNDRNSNQDIDVLVKVMKLDLKCELDYTYDYGWLNGDGWLKLTTDDNSAYTKLRFTSDDFNTQPPKDSSVEECFADIEIADMDFEGDFVSGIIEIFQRLIRGAVERAIGNVACDELGSLGTTLVSGMLELAQEQLEPYRGVLAGAFTDPLFPERNLDLTDGLVALDLKDSKSAVANLFSQALLGADTFMGTLISDSTGATSTGRDLAINIFLRNYFLDDQQAFTLEASQLPMESPVIFKSHDRITETTITLNKVKVLGLDTLSRFNPFIEIGSYTLQNELTWDTLTIDFDVTVDIKPSTFEDAILQDPTSEGISERVSINFAVDNVDVVASLFLLIDAEALGSLELGPLLHTDNFLPCLLSAVHKAELSGLEVDPQDVNEPTLNGFISPGVDRIITDSVEAAFEMYSGVLKRAIPNIFQTSVRDFINDKVISSYMRNTEHTDCPAVEAFEGYLDFRKFFDAETNTYGDLPPMLKNLFDSELLAIDPSTEKPRINDILIGPYTGKQSGIEGNIEFTGDIFGFLSETIPQFGMDFIELRAFDLSAKNVDSLGSPLDLLRPNATDGFLLDNIANFGVGPDPLTFALKGLFALNGDPLLAMHNEVELSVNVADSELFATLMTQVDAKALSSFPLRDIVNPECWLAILAKPMLDDDGNLRDGSDIGLTFESILLSISSVSFDFTCTNCTSPGLQVVSELLRVLEEAGVSDVLEHRFVDLGLDFLKSDYIQAYINRALIEGSLRCPHSLDYVAGDAISDYPVPSFPSLPYKSLESIAFASTVLVQMATVVIAESHSTYDVDANDPLSGEAQLALEPGVRLVDFTSLETSIGAWAGIGVEQLKNYLGAVVDDPKGEDGKDLRINELLRSTFLDDNGLLDIKFNDLSIGGEEMEVSLKHIRVFGLDSILSLNVLEAIGSQTLRNQLKWKKLGVQVVVSLMAPEVNTPLGRSLKTKQDVTLSLELADVDISLALLLALDLDLMGSLQFSSILHIKNILPCLLSAAQAAALTELKVSVGSITSFVIDGFQSSELSAAAAESSRVILEKYGATILSSIPAFFDMTVRAMSNNWISYYLSESTSVGCPISSFEAKSSEFVDFRDLLLSATTSRFFGGSGSAPYGNLFSTAIGFVRDLLLKVDASTGLSAVNDALIAPLTESQSESTGRLLFPGDLLSGGSKRVRVGGLDATEFSCVPGTPESTIWILWVLLLLCWKLLWTKRLS